MLSDDYNNWNKKPCVEVCLLIEWIWSMNFYSNSLHLEIEEKKDEKLIQTKTKTTKNIEINVRWMEK